MSSRTAEKSDGRQSGPCADEPDLKWAVEWLVRRRGQRRAAEMLGVDRKTVALALRRERLTVTMTYAVQTLMARVDDPDTEEVTPLDRMESQIRLLVESVGELEGLVEGLTRRVEAVEGAGAGARAEAETPGVGEAERGGRRHVG